MAAGDGAQLPATVAASRSVEKALEEAAVSGALNLSNRRLKEFPRSARNYDLSDITHAGWFAFYFFSLPSHRERASCYHENAFCYVATCLISLTGKAHRFSEFKQILIFSSSLGHKNPK